MELLTFVPLYMERVWGGRGLESKLGRRLPKDKMIGESWEIVDRDQEQSIVAAGAHAGKTIREILENYAEIILGPGRDGAEPFPILTKWLDCQSRLSLQVHPTVEIANALGSESKTENWYLAECDEQASLFVGLKCGVTREQFSKALAEGKAEDCVHRISSIAGDSILVPSGRMHAIGAGNLILEIQQNSDTTYRVYDWGRLGLDAAPRQLHIEEALQTIDFEDFEPELLKAENGTQILADCKEFRIRKFELSPDDTLELPAGLDARLIHMVTGEVTDTLSETVLIKSRSYLQAYETSVSLSANKPTTLLITDRF